MKTLWKRGFLSKIGSCDVVMIRNRVAAVQRAVKTVPLTFSRSSVAYDGIGQVVPINTPRYLSYNGKWGALIEEAHTNLLTANQSTGGDTSGDTTGFNTFRGDEVLTYQTTTKYQGNGCIKCVTDGSHSVEGLYLPLTLSATTTYTFTSIINIPNAQSMQLAVYDGTDYLYSVNFTPTGSWQLISGTFTTTSHLSVTIYLRINGTRAMTFYVDMLQLTATSYPLSWTLGGTTTTAESLTIPSSTLNVDTGGSVNLLTPNQSTGGDTSSNTTGFTAHVGNETITYDTTTKYSGTGSIKTVCDHGGPYEGCWIYTTVSTGINTASLWVKVNIAGVAMRMILTNESKSGTYTETDFTSTGDWQHVSATLNVTGADENNIQFFVDNKSSTDNYTIWYDQLQLEPRSSMTDWILGGTTRNTGAGTIEGEFYHTTPTKNTASTHYLFNSAGSAYNINNISVYITNGNIYMNTSDYRGTGSTTTAIDITGQNDGYYKYNARYDNSSIILTVYNSTGAIVGSTQTVSNPALPVVSTSTYLGCTIASASQLDSNQRNVVVHRYKMTQAESDSRALQPTIMPDRRESAYIPLENNIQGFSYI